MVLHFPNNYIKLYCNTKNMLRNIHYRYHMIHIIVAFDILRIRTAFFCVSCRILPTITQLQHCSSINNYIIL
jgi:hypothetical protein